MIDTYVALSPILLLMVVALIKFIGCGFSPTPSNPIVKTIEPASGSCAGGQVTGKHVTITVSGFSDPVSVTFDGIDASAGMLMNSQTILASPPPHEPGTVDVTVTEGSSNATLASAYTYQGVRLGDRASAHAASGTSTASADLASSGSGRMLLVTVMWHGANPAATATITGGSATFQQLGSDFQSPKNIAHFFASNVTTPITITANLSGASNFAWDMLVSAYDFASPNTAPDHVTHLKGTGKDLALQFLATGAFVGDMVYVAALAQNSAGALVNNNLVAGTNLPFATEFGLGYMLVEDYFLLQPDLDAGQINVTATNTDSSAATSKWYLFAVRIPQLLT